MTPRFKVRAKREPADYKHDTGSWAQFASLLLAGRATRLAAMVTLIISFGRVLRSVLTNGYVPGPHRPGGEAVSVGFKPRAMDKPTRSTR